MCAINGIFAYHAAASPVDENELARARDHMAARGPDGSGAWISADRRIGLGHRRLAIIDLSDAAAQPMSSRDGEIRLVFNGEIYNYRELRTRLEAAGHRFRTTSDTEVILHLYKHRGPGMVRELRGMFAIALWDEGEQRLMLARDPYGIKPLYYADDGWTLRFASQVKALIASGAVSTARDPAGWAGFHLLGSVPEPFTTCRAIRSVAAGTLMTIERDGVRRTERYHRIADVYRRAEMGRPARLSASETAARFRAAMIDSVGSHLVADVPVGAFLSAGIDSGALVGLMRDAGARDIRTVTVAFEELRGTPQDEAPLAEAVARRNGTHHTTRIVTRAEFDADLPAILAAMDQPSIDGINVWFAAKAAREVGLKVVLSGLGGDELLGGYPSFHDVPRIVRWARPIAWIPGLGRAVRGALSALQGKPFAFHPKFAGLLEYGGTYPGAYLLRRGLFMNWELPHVMPADEARDGLRRLAAQSLIERELVDGPRDGRARVATLEATIYMRNQLLRDADWAGMAHSLEIRVPLADTTLLGEIAALQLHAHAMSGKQLLANCPSVALPAEIAGRRKTGFTTPIAEWLQSMKRPGGDLAAPLVGGDGGPWARRWACGLAGA